MDNFFGGDVIKYMEIVLKPDKMFALCDVIKSISRQNC